MSSLFESLHIDYSSNIIFYRYYNEGREVSRVEVTLQNNLISKIDYYKLDKLINSYTISITDTSISIVDVTLKKCISYMFEKNSYVHHYFIGRGQDPTDYSNGVMYSVGYSTNGISCSVSDEYGNSVLYILDSKERLIEEVRSNNSNTYYSITHYEYDDNDYLIKQSTPVYIHSDYNIINQSDISSKCSYTTKSTVYPNVTYYGISSSTPYIWRDEGMFAANEHFTLVAFCNCPTNTELSISIYGFHLEELKYKIINEYRSTTSGEQFIIYDFEIPTVLTTISITITSNRSCMLSEVELYNKSSVIEYQYDNNYNLIYQKDVTTKLYKYNNSNYVVNT